MKLQTKITKVVNIEGQTFTFTTSPKNQVVAHSSYKGAGLIKRKQSDGKRERTQATLERIEQTFFHTLATARKLERIEKVETFKAERSNNQREERRAKRK
jgi:ClpP class serine protease